MLLNGATAISMLLSWFLLFISITKGTQLQNATALAIMLLNGATKNYYLVFLAFVDCICQLA